MSFPFTPALQEVAALLRQGFSTQRIADELGIVRDTAQSHLNDVYRILGVSNRFEAYAKLIDEELKDAANTPPRRCYRCEKLIFAHVWDRHEVECLERCRQSAMKAGCA